MSRAMAQREDLDGIAEAVATAGAAADQITYIEANADSDVYASGKWTAGQAGSLEASVPQARTLDRWSLAQANLGASDIMDLGVITEAQDVIFPTQRFNADAIIMHPKQMADLKRSPQFLDASKAGPGFSVLKTGQVGSFFGLNVYVSPNLKILKCQVAGGTKGYQAIMMDTSAALALVIKRTVTVETEYKPADRKHYIYITAVYKFKRMNAGAIVVINTC
jgi:hypothetical protein